MSRSRLPAVACVCALGLMAVAGAAYAQSNPYYYGQSATAPTTGCPGMTWNFRAGVKNPYGYVWFNDDSGLSRANGTIDPTTGAFHLTLTVLDGKGPTGTIDGVKGGDGSLKAVVTGPGCSNVTIYHAKPDVVDENDGSNQ